MKIAVMGSGGVGGLYGGRLAHAGCDVTFVARGAHLAAMREHGLTIENETQGNIHLPQRQRDRRSRDASGRSISC